MTKSHRRIVFSSFRIVRSWRASTYVLTSRAAVKNFTAWPRRQASRPNAMAKCVFPTPGGPVMDATFAMQDQELKVLLATMEKRAREYEQKIEGRLGARN